MSDIPKTALFILVTLVSLFAVFYTAPQTQQSDTNSMLQQPVFEEVGEAHSLEIVKHDGTNAKPFRVEKRGQRYVIPSQGDYPADARLQMQRAATLLSGLIVNQVASEVKEDAKTYGVLDPTDNVQFGEEKVGTKVSMKDENGTAIAELIIGQASKDDAKMRFVRKPNQNLIYLVELDIDALSTNFRDWIEKNLLRFDQFDIQKIRLKKYKAEPSFFNASSRKIESREVKREFDIEISSVQNQWVVTDLVTYDSEQKPVSKTLGPKEYVDVNRINLIKSELANLEIADVNRKPADFSEELSFDRQTFASNPLNVALQGRGFFPIEQEDGFDVVSRSGEMIVTLRSGVEYLLRFGKYTNNATEGEDPNRFLMVSTRVSETAFPMPVKAKPKSAIDSPPEEEGAPEEGGCSPQDEDQKEELERIEREYQNKLLDRQEKLEAANITVRELNRRFKDWFYIISDDSVQKLNFTLKDVISVR